MRSRQNNKQLLEKFVFLPKFRFRRALKHHLFLLAYPDSSAKSGKIEPADVSHIVKQRQLLPSHSPEILYRPAKDVLSERCRLRLVKATHFAWATYWQMCKSCITYLLNYILYVCILKELSHPNLQRFNSESQIF